LSSSDFTTLPPALSNWIAPRRRARHDLAVCSKMKVDRAKELEHRVIVYCKADRDVKRCVVVRDDTAIADLGRQSGRTLDRPWRSRPRFRP